MEQELFYDGWQPIIQRFGHEPENHLAVSEEPRGRDVELKELCVHLHKFLDTC